MTWLRVIWPVFCVKNTCPTHQPVIKNCCIKVNFKESFNVLQLTLINCWDNYIWACVFFLLQPPPHSRSFIENNSTKSINRSSRKAWLLITIFAIHSTFLLPSFFGGKRKGEKITKVVVKSHAFLLDPINQLMGVYIPLRRAMART